MTDTQSLIPAPARYADGRFGPGNPGRRPGARGRAANRVAIAILEDFLANQTKMLNDIRGNPHAYMAVLMKVLASSAAEQEAPDVHAWSEAEVAQGLASARAALDRGDDGRGALIELEAVLLSEGPVR